jgi:hypothetical protein
VATLLASRITLTGVVVGIIIIIRFIFVVATTASEYVERIRNGGGYYKWRMETAAGR